jgi:hypothetical protein
MCLETARWADPEIEELENFEAVIPRLAAAELKLEFLTQMSEPDGLSVSASLSAA